MISLLICTRNRAPQLDRCLDHIGRLDYRGEWELIVVDNGSIDHTPQVVKSFAQRSSIDVRLVDSPRTGLSHARNAAIAHARGDILCFTDDDCYVAPDYLTRIEAIFRESPEVGYVGGRVLLHDPEDARITILESQTCRVFPGGGIVEAGSIHGANMALRREAIVTVGTFDPLLGAGGPLRSGEDIDMIARFAAAGFAGCYDPRPVVWHHHMRRPGPALRAQRRGYDLGRGAVYFKALFRRPTCRTYVSYWLTRLHRGPRRRGLRELLGAALYCVYSVREKLRWLGPERDRTDTSIGHHEDSRRPLGPTPYRRSP